MVALIPQRLVDFITSPPFAAAILATAVGGATWWVHHSTLRIKRGEWLLTLYRQFYEESRHKKMRYTLDYRREPAYGRLIASLDSQSTDPIEERLVDYLNFFEFVATLWRTDRLHINEVLALFEYYLRNIDSNPRIRAYVETQGFGLLSDLLSVVRKLPVEKRAPFLAASQLLRRLSEPEPMVRLNRRRNGRPT